MGRGGLIEMSNVNSSKSKKNINYMSCGKRCHYGQKNLTEICLQRMRSILIQNINIIKNNEKNIIFELCEFCIDNHM